MAKAKPAAGKPAVPAVPQGPRPTISLCMMVKNEEKRLRTALKSAAPWVDEIIVVDTGSTDRTVEIAKEFGAKVYHHLWEYSFSKHRNQSIAYATGDWLLILDADEELDPETAPALRELVHAPAEINGFLFELYNKVSVGGDTFILHARLFRNRVGFHYQGQVHNRPMVPGTLARTKIRLWHYGYNEDAGTMEAKHQRRLSMIRKWAQDEPDNYSPHSYLAHTLASKPETIPEALEEALIALDLLKNHPEKHKHYPHVYYPLLQTMAYLNRDEELIKHARDCMELAPTYPDAVFFLVLLFFKRKDWEETRRLSELFMQLQAECALHPDRFIFFENLTINQQHQVTLRWAVAEAYLGRLDQAREIFLKLFSQQDPEAMCKLAVRDLMAGSQYEIAKYFAELAAEREPGWAWPKLMGKLAGDKLEEAQASLLRADGLKALEDGRPQEAVRFLRQALKSSPLDAEALLSLGKALEAQGLGDEALQWYMRGLNAHPGHPWAWKRIGDFYFGQGNHRGAQACYRRYLAQVGRDEATALRLSTLERRQAQVEPSVAQSPPQLLVFLVSGLTPEMVKQFAPHFLIGTAWGSFLHAEGEPAPDLRGWASLYTGLAAQQQALAASDPWARPPRLDDLATLSVWELLSERHSLGLLAAPLCQPPLALPGWTVAGYPHGLLSPEMVQPAALAPQVLATGYRSDYLLSDFDQQTYAHRLANDVRGEGFLFQVERNKLTTAAGLPAVDVLVLGLTALDYFQRVNELASYQAFAAYQQAYAWIEGLLAGIRPANFAILSQRGYHPSEKRAERGGFYCLSWRKGENGQANITDIAPEILKLMGADPSRLGRPR